MTSSKHSLLCFKLAAVLLAFLLSTCVWAAEPAGTVLFSHGKVLLNNQQPLAKDDAIYADNEISTGAQGRVQIRFTDGGLVSILPNSRFIVKEYTQPNADGEGRAIFKLAIGGMRAVTGSIGHKNHDNYQLKTDVATLGIRGTEFFVTYQNKTMHVHVGAGAVALYNDFGELHIDAGHNGIVSENEAPKSTPEQPNIDDSSTDDAAADDEESTTESTPDTAAAPQETQTDDTYNNLPAEFIVSEEQNNEPIDISDITKVVVTRTPFGDLASLNINDVDPDNLDASNLNKVGEFYWSEEGFDAPNPFGGEVDTYIYGSPVNLNPSISTGTLSFSLDTNGPTQVLDDTGAIHQLTKFDMDINFDETEFEVDMAISDGATFATSGPESGSLDDGIFSFSSNNNGGELEVKGMFADEMASQAGVVYRMNDTNNTYTGGAILK